jgi:hypothetical protein
MYCFHVKRSEDNHASTSGRVLTTAKRNLSRLGLFRLAGRLGVRLELLKPTSCETSYSAELRNDHDAASIEKNGNLGRCSKKEARIMTNQLTPDWTVELLVSFFVTTSGGKQTNELICL